MKRVGFLLAATLLLLVDFGYGQEEVVPYNLSLYRQYRQQFLDLKDTEERRIVSRWVELIDGFERVIDLDELDSSVVPGSLFYIGRCYDNLHLIGNSRSNLQKAISKFQDLFERFPGHDLADDALYRAGLLSEELGDEDHAIGFYRRIISDYVRGDQLAKAVGRLKDFSVSPSGGGVPVGGVPVTRLVGNSSEEGDLVHNSEVDGGVNIHVSTDDFRGFMGHADQMVRGLMSTAVSYSIVGAIFGAFLMLGLVLLALKFF